MDFRLARKSACWIIVSKVVIMNIFDDCLQICLVSGLYEVVVVEYVRLLCLGLKIGFQAGPKVSLQRYNLKMRCF